MKTTIEILKEAGQTDEQIKSIMATLGPAAPLFDGILKTADQQATDAAAKLAEAADKTKKLNEFWTGEATPQINEALSGKASAEASAAFYRTQVEEAKKSGFIAADAPGYKAEAEPKRNPDGTFVRGEVPGSPGYMTMEQGMDALSEAAYLMTEHQRLFNVPLPNLRELTQVRGRKARDVWEDKYKVSERRAAIAAEEQTKVRETIRKEEREKLVKEFGDRNGNENTRTLMPSRFPNYAKDEKTGVADKLAWTRSDKRERLRSRIHDQVNRDTSTVH